MILEYQLPVHNHIPVKNFKEYFEVKELLNSNTLFNEKSTEGVKKRPGNVNYPARLISTIGR